jgi:hypothetical protein
MNVYQQNYDPEFIKQLPVDFNKIKNIDLSTIPEVFHDLFKTDWNWGNHSKMKYQLRNIMNELHTEYVNWMIFEKDKPKKQEEVFLGGFD